MKTQAQLEEALEMVNSSQAGTFLEIFAKDIAKLVLEHVLDKTNVFEEKFLKPRTEAMKQGFSE